jgi:DNA-binding response OmpR family regulator
MKKYILLIDDDPALTTSTSFNLQKLGYETATVSTAEAGISMISQRVPDVILLDIGLPDMDGLEALRVIQQHADVPVIFVTARRRELDQIIGLELGAADYITKPFDMDVLLARIKAVLRRTSTLTKPRLQQISVGDLHIEADARMVWLGEETIDMSPKEFDLLLTLAHNAGCVLSLDYLLTQVWGTDWIGEAQTIYVHIRWLREKIEKEPAQPRRLLTVKGSGYKLVPITETG